MTDDDIGEFSDLLIATAEMLKEELSPLRIELYFNALKQYDIETIRDALNIHVRESVFFPKPADFVRIIEGSGSQKATMAWLTVLRAIEQHGYYDSVVFDGPVARTIEAMGGWQQMADIPRKDLVWAEKEFYRYYEVFARHDGRPKKLTGYIEEHNSAKGYLEDIPDAIDCTSQETPLLEDKRSATGLDRSP